MDWQPNNIELHWYNGDTEITSGVQTSCVYDGTLTPPTTIPTKTGYTFKGWRVKQAQCGFASSVCGLTGNDLNNLPYVDHGYKSIDGERTYNANTYNLTENGTWAVELSNGGIMRGVGICNNTSPTVRDTIMEGLINGTMTGEQAQAAVYGSCESDAIQSNINNTPGGYCWCKMTSYTPSGESACNLVTSSWVSILNTDEGAESCAHGCTEACASFNSSSIEFRRALFGVSQ